MPEFAQKERRPQSCSKNCSNMNRQEKREIGDSYASSSPRTHLGHDFSRVKIYTSRRAMSSAGLTASGLIQTKLVVSQPGDEYEREADRIADEVMRMPQPYTQEEIATVSRKPLLQAKQSPGRIPQITPDIEDQINNSSGGGQPLPMSVRAFFEPRFEYEFNDVRIHSDERAAQLARAIQARSFALGSNIFFDHGEYSPFTASGKKLLAHELTHVAQQRNARRLNKEIYSCKNGSAERRGIVRNIISPNCIGRAERIYNVIDAGVRDIVDQGNQNDPEFLSSRRIIEVTDRAPGTRIEVRSLEEMIDRLANLIPPGDCLRELVIWNHGSPEGQVVARTPSDEWFDPHPGEGRSRFDAQWAANPGNRNRLNTLRRLFCCNRGRIRWMGCAVAGVYGVSSPRASEELQQCIERGEVSEYECRERYERGGNVFQNLPEALSHEPSPSTLQFGVANMQYWANATCTMVTGATDFINYLPNSPVPYRILHGGQMVGVLPTVSCPCERDRVSGDATGIGPVPTYLQSYLDRECGPFELGLFQYAVGRAVSMVSEAIQSLQEFADNRDAHPTPRLSRTRQALEVSFDLWDPVLWDPVLEGNAALPQEQVGRIQEQHRQTIASILDRFIAIHDLLAASSNDTPAVSAGTQSSEEAPTVDSPGIRCLTGQHSECLRERTFAKANPNRHRISLCPRFFGPIQIRSMDGWNIRTSDDRRALVLIHEYSHLARTTDSDGGHEWRGCPPAAESTHASHPDFASIADAYRCFIQILHFGNR
jgi:hypothetical protein